MPLSFSLNKAKLPNGPPKQPISHHVSKSSQLSKAVVLGDDEDHAPEQPKQHQITAFGDGAEEPVTERARVIPRLENDSNGVMGGKRRKKRRRDEEAESGQGNGVVKEEQLNGKTPLGFGLTVVDRSNEETEHTSGDGQSESVNGHAKGEESEEDLDSKALRALKGEDVGLRTDARITPPTEDAMFSRDFSQAPAPGTLQDYDVTPVEGFGAAILRGYLKQGEKLEDRMAAHKRGENIKDVKSRPGLLGLGAKQAEGMNGVELSAWGAKRGKDAVGYNPLVRRNKVTGEVLSEAELNRKLEQQKREDKGKDKDWQARRAEDDLHPRSRDSDREGERRARRRDGDRDGGHRSSRRDRSRDNHKSSRRDRSRSHDRRDQRRDERRNDDDTRSHKQSRRDRRDDSRDRNRHR